MNVPYTLTNESITVVWEGKPHTVQKGSPNFASLRAAIIAENWDQVPQHLTVAKSVKEWAKGKFTLTDDGKHFLYASDEIPEQLNNRIFAMASAGEDPEPLFKFWERLQKNPSWRSVAQLWGFMAHNGIPITKDGCILAYKGVKSNYTDCHTGTISNEPGTVNEMPRNKISDDPNQACHYGFHVGAIGHAQGYGTRMIICKVDPEHVVCIPFDAGQQKMRVCKYEVIGNHGTTLPSTTFIDDAELRTHAAPQEEPEDEEELDDRVTSHEDDDTDAEDDEAAQDAIDEGEDEDDLDTDDEVEEEAKPVADSEGMKLKKGDFKPLATGSAYDKLGMKELLELSITDLRQYAGHHLKIVGCSKIPGGKVALVATIMKTRKG